MKILMVCLGNICRSPLAQGILEQKIMQAGLDWEVDSCGTGGWYAGEKPDNRSIAIAKKYGIDISKQRARKVRSTDFGDFDLIFAMDSQNYQDLIHQCVSEDEKQKIKLILNELYPEKNIAVPDPYYGGEDGFESVYQMLNAACDKIIENYNKNS
jgi:protein-tyrosine phosphatase